MTNAVHQQYNQHQFDRLGLTIFLALAVHAILILGISFDFEELLPEKNMPTMEITLVHSQSKDAPEDADYLAQANQKGGGNVEERVRPSSPFSNPMPTTEDGLAPNSKLDFSPPPLEKKEQQKEVITADKSASKEKSQDFERDVPLESKSEQAAQLYERSRQFAKLRAEIQQLKQAYQKTPHHTYVAGINAKEYRFARYTEAWRDKIERIGTLNYPDGHNGTVFIDVAINADGSIHSTKILRSSGDPKLDEAAIKIARMAAPFPPLSKEILKDTDILHISQVWGFQSTKLVTTNNK